MGHGSCVLYITILKRYNFGRKYIKKINRNCLWAAKLWMIYFQFYSLCISMRSTLYNEHFFQFYDKVCLRVRGTSKLRPRNDKDAREGP